MFHYLDMILRITWPITKQCCWQCLGLKKKHYRELGNNSNEKGTVKIGRSKFSIPAVFWFVGGMSVMLCPPVVSFRVRSQECATAQVEILPSKARPQEVAAWMLQGPAGWPARTLSAAGAVESWQM